MENTALKPTIEVNEPTPVINKLDSMQVVNPEPTPVVTEEKEAYIPNIPSVEERDNKYVNLLKAKRLFGLPKILVITGTLDPLHDEGINYYNRLKEKNTNVKLIKTKETVHGYDIILKSKITKDSMQKRIEFLKENIK